MKTVQAHVHADKHSVVPFLQSSILFNLIKSFYLFENKPSSLNEYFDLLRICFTAVICKRSLCSVSENSVPLGPLLAHVQHLYLYRAHGENKEEVGFKCTCMYG